LYIVHPPFDDDDDDDAGAGADDDDPRSPIFLGGFSWLLSPFSKDLLVQDGLECTLVLPRLAALSTQLVRTDADFTTNIATENPRGLEMGMDQYLLIPFLGG
jgi:hypothetical protein